MQESAGSISSLAAALGLGAAMSDGLRPVPEPGGDDPFAALLAAAQAAASGETLPDSGKILPPVDDLPAASSFIPPPSAGAPSRSTPPAPDNDAAWSTAADARPAASTPYRAATPLDRALPLAAATMHESPARAAAVHGASEREPLPDSAAPGPTSASTAPASAAPDAAPLAAVQRQAGAAASLPGAAPVKIHARAAGPDPVPAEVDPRAMSPADASADFAAELLGADAPPHALGEPDAYGPSREPPPLRTVGYAATSADAGGAAPGAGSASIAAIAPAADAAVEPPPARAPTDAPIDGRRTPTEVGEAMAGRIRMLVEHGAGEARLRLHPAELGAVDVRISVIDEQAFVHLSASHSAARDVLEQSLPRLRELLAEGGLALGGASVESGERDAEPRPSLGAGETTLTFAYLDDDPLSAAPGDAARAAPADGRIDLYA